MFLGGWCNWKWGGSLHLIPRNDLKPHWVSEDGDCWCQPTEDIELKDYWVHHSMDRREDYEAGVKKFH